MKKGQIYCGKVIETEFPNKGIIEIEDRKVCVKGAIKGQEVEFVLSKKRSGVSQGRLKKVIKKSELEDTVAPCPHFGQCGGCSYQTLSYENQTKLKASQVKKIIDNVCKDYEWQGIISSPYEWGYRNKMEFTFGDEYKDGPLALGMHKKDSFHDIVSLNDCRIVSKDYNAVLKCVLDYFKDTNIKFYKRLSHEGTLRHLVVRRSVATGDMLVNLVTTSAQEVDMNGLSESLLSLKLDGKIVGILQTINDSLADVVTCDELRLIYGQDYFYEELLGMKFKISPFSFFQTNTLGAEKLYEKAREFITESYYNGNVSEMRGATIYDLYSGTGTIAQMMAEVCGHVVGVEIVEEAVMAAKENAKLNGLDNCTFLAGDVLKVLDDIEDKPDYIILDPPRDGIHPKALDKIIAYGVDHMVYISCKPTSLARDLVILQEKGYKVEKVCAVDMFPQTVHVETVVLLSQQKPEK